MPWYLFHRCYYIFFWCCLFFSLFTFQRNWINRFNFLMVYSHKFCRSSSRNPICTTSVILYMFQTWNSGVRAQPCRLFMHLISCNLIHVIFITLFIFFQTSISLDVTISLHWNDWHIFRYSFLYNCSGSTCRRELWFAFYVCRGWTANWSGENFLIANITLFKLAYAGNYFFITLISLLSIIFCHG